MSSRIDKILKALRAEVKPKAKFSSHNAGVRTSMSIAPVPVNVEKRGKDWVLYGEDNLYPNKIDELPNGSAIHNSILKTKIKMMTGDGLLIDGAKTKEESDAKYVALPSEVKAKYDWFLKNPNAKMSMDKIREKLSSDLQKQGYFAYEVVFNNEFDQIVTVKHLEAKNIRSGKFEDGEVKKYWYCRDWAQCNKKEYEPKEYHVFTGEDKTHLNQIVFEKVGDAEYYGTPPYVGAITWIYTDCEMGYFHNANVSNGMAPGMHFNFFKVPASQDEEDAIVDGIDKTFKGGRRAGTRLITFSEGKDLSMELKPIEASNLDKQMIVLAELCDKKILSGHQLTSPLLAGISVSGQLGGNTELESAFKIFDKVTIEADRQLLTNSLQMVLDYNKIPVTIDVNPFNPFIGAKTTQSVITINNGN